MLCSLLGIHHLLGKKTHLDVQPKHPKLHYRAIAPCDMPHQGDFGRVAFVPALQVVFGHHSFSP